MYPPVYTRKVGNKYAAFNSLTGKSMGPKWEEWKSASRLWAQLQSEGYLVLSKVPAQFR